MIDHIKDYSKSAIADFIARHWRGQQDLLLTSAVILIGIRVVIGIIQHTALSDTSLGALTLWLTFSFSVLVWQLVGGWRTCENHIRSGGGMIAGWVGYAALLITFALAVFQALDGISSQVKIQPAPTAQPIDLQLRDDNTVIVIDKPLDWPLFSTFKSLLEQHQSITTVVLDSTGGRVYTARAMALLIDEHRLDTHVEQVCFPPVLSLLWLAGIALHSLTQSWAFINMHCNKTTNCSKSILIRNSQKTGIFSHARVCQQSLSIRFFRQHQILCGNLIEKHCLMPVS